MKPELNNETKLRFYAQYYGQRVFAYGYVDWESPNQNNRLTWYVLRDSPESSNDASYYDFLDLKPLSAISDEELQELRVLLNETKYPLSKVRKVVENYKYEVDSSDITDFLRSKGYALPFQGISVEEQVQAGWVKLIKENHQKLN